MEKFGGYLREERERKGYSIEQVEEETKIRKYYLEALENDSFEKLPPQVYSVGFVKRYAKFLNLEEQPLANEFKRIAYPEKSIEEKNNENIIKQEDTRNNFPIDGKFSVKNIIAGLVFLVFAVWAGNYLLNYITQNADYIPAPTPPIIEEEPKLEEEEPIIPIEKAHLLISANNNCWLLVQVDGEEVFEGILYTGEELEFIADKKIYLKAGNAGGIDLVFNNEKLPSLGNYGQVIDKELTINE